jgi:hypothetical protein
MTVPIAPSKVPDTVQARRVGRQWPEGEPVEL